MVVLPAIVLEASRRACDALAAGGRSLCALLLAWLPWGGRPPADVYTAAARALKDSLGKREVELLELTMRDIFYTAQMANTQV